MSNQFVLTKEERQKLFEVLAGAIEQSGLNLNEYIFATADLLKSTFWVSQTANLSDEEVDTMRNRVVSAVEGVVEVLNENTQTVAEDMIVLATVMLEAVNHIFALAKEAEEAAAAAEVQPVE